VRGLLAVFAFAFLIRCGGSGGTVVTIGSSSATATGPLSGAPPTGTPEHPLPLMRTRTTPVHGTTPTASPTPTVTRTA
jgi:hypothetical protein